MVSFKQNFAAMQNFEDETKLDKKTKVVRGLTAWMSSDAILMGH